MPKINVYLPDALAEAVRDAQLPVSAICQSALERAVRDVTSARGTDNAPTGDQPAIGVLGRFTQRAREAMTLAEKAARAIPHNYVGTEHLLIGVIDQGTNLALRVLAALDIEPGDLRDELIASMDKKTKAAAAHVPLTPLAKQALEETAKEAMALGHNYIGCEHLLLGVLAVESGIGGQVLRRMGVEQKTTRRAVITTLIGYAHARATPPTPEAVPTQEATLDAILRRLDAIEQRLAG